MKTIITDVDGTIFYDGKISDKTLNALKEVQKEHRLIIATGRNFAMCKSLAEQLEMTKYNTGGLVCVNGTYIYDFSTGSGSSIKDLPHNLSKEAFDIASRYTDNVVAFYDDSTYAKPTLKRIQTVLKRKQKLKLFFKREGVRKIEFVYDGPKLKEILDQLKDHEIVESANHHYEIVPVGISKFSGLKYFIDKYNIDINDIYAFGDAGNDTPMLKEVPHSYCPENGLDEAKEAANYSMAKDGISDVIYSEILK